MGGHQRATSRPPSSASWILALISFPALAIEASHGLMAEHERIRVHYPSRVAVLADQNEATMFEGLAERARQS